MRDEVVIGTERVRVSAAGKRSAVIEVEFVDLAPPSKWRRRLASWLLRIAGRLARMRIRISR